MTYGRVYFFKTNGIEMSIWATDYSSAIRERNRRLNELNKTNDGDHV